MAQTSNVNINLNSKADLKGFKQAETATQKLMKTTKKLAASLGIAYGTKAVLAYANASLKAAAADQKSQLLLSSNLKNLGLAYANVDSETFIKSMETQTHIADDLLRPAFAQLAQVTGSIATTQRVMGIAFDTASGTGLDYAQTIDILSQAYVGNRKGLKQLNTGLSTAQLAALSFDQLLVVLNEHFGGAGTAAVKGYAGQMDALTISLGNVQEILGGALLDSFAKMAGNGDITKATTKIEAWTTALAGALKVLTGVYDMNAILSQVEFGGFLGLVPKNKPASSIPMQSPADRAAIDKANAKQIASQKELAKLAKAQAAAALATAKAKRDQAALDKAALALGKGQNVFDMDAIQLNAAMLSSTEALGKATSQTQLLSIANDLARLTIKQDMLVLEDAIAAKDVAGATAAAKKLNTDIAILGTLSNQSLKLADIKTILESFVPKSLIDLANLDAAIAKITELNRLQGTKTLVPANTPNAVIPTITTPTVKAPSATGGKLGTITQAETTILLQTALGTDALFEYWDAATAAANAAADLLDYQNAQNEAAFKASSLYNAGSTLNFNAPIYTISDAEFAANVQRAIQNNNRFGNNLDYAGGIG